MTNTATAPASTTTKRTAEAPTMAASSSISAVQKPKGGAKAKAEAPQAPLYTMGPKLPPVRPGTHRAYAQDIIKTLTKKHRNGFTLAQFRQALIDSAEASSIAPPRGGWASHNMPTWCAKPANEWLVPVK